MENDNNISVEIENSKMAPTMTSDDKAIFSLHALASCSNVVTIEIVNISFVQQGFSETETTAIKIDDTVSYDYPSTVINSCGRYLPSVITFFIENTTADTDIGIDIRIHKFSWILFNLTMIGSSFSAFYHAL